MLNLNFFNRIQKQVIQETQNNILIHGGPGTGKTLTILSRIIYLLENGIYPGNILCLNINNRQTKSIQDNLKKCFSLQEINGIYTDTFLSLCMKILKQDIELLGYDKNFKLLGPYEQLKVINDCLNELDYYPEILYPKELMWNIAKEKGLLVDDQKFAKEKVDNSYKEKFSKVYTLYQKKMKNMGAIDSGDAIILTTNILKETNMANFYKRKFRFVMVDDYQDVNYAQNQILNLISPDNICIANDENQMIYSGMDNFLNNYTVIMNNYPELKIFKLEKNYRSTKEIVNFANQFILNTGEDKGYKLWTDNEIGKKICFHKASNTKHEIDYIINIVKMLKKNSDIDNYGDIAILFRSSIFFNEIINELTKEEVPFKLDRKHSFYRKESIEEITNILKFLDDSDNIENNYVIINEVCSIIDYDSLEFIKEYADDKKICFFNGLKEVYKENIINIQVKNVIGKFNELLLKRKNLKVYELIQEIYNMKGYIKKYKNESSIENTLRLDDLTELYSAAVEFENISNDKTLYCYLKKIENLKKDENNIDDKGVNILTINEARGLEFQYVIVPDLESPIFAGEIYNNNEEDLLDYYNEFRIFYMAITRGKKGVFLSSSDKNNWAILKNDYYFKQKTIMEEIPLSLCKYSEENNIFGGFKKNYESK